MLILLLQGASVESAYHYRRKKKTSAEEVDVMKNKNLEAVTEEQLQVEPRCIAQHPGVGDT